MVNEQDNMLLTLANQLRIEGEVQGPTADLEALQGYEDIYMCVESTMLD